MSKSLKDFVKHVGPAYVEQATKSMLGAASNMFLANENTLKDLKGKEKGKFYLTYFLFSIAQ